MRKLVLENKLGKIESYTFRGKTVYMAICNINKWGELKTKEVCRIETLDMAKQILWEQFDDQSIDIKGYWYRTGKEHEGFVSAWILIDGESVMSIGELNECITWNVKGDDFWTEKALNIKE